eukprot:1143002_1
MMSTTLFIVILIGMSIVSSQRDYSQAECNGTIIYSFANKAGREVVDITFDPTADDPIYKAFNFNITNAPNGTIEYTWESAQLDPSDKVTVWALITLTLGATSPRYIAKVNFISGTNTITLGNPITLIPDPVKSILGGMAIDCDGTIYIIETQDYSIYQLDPSTGNATFLFQGSGNCCSPGSCDCSEVIGYNMNDNLLYRISSPTNFGEAKLYRRNSDGTETESSISDPNDLCDGASQISAMEYIGNELWLISCDSNSGAVRLLDTQDFSNPIIGPIGTNGVVYNQGDGVDRSGSGLIGSVNGNTQCTPECSNSTVITPAPTTPSPSTPAPLTPSPITPAPTTPAPTTPAPITPAPITPAPITPAPITPAPTTPAPVTPAPTTPSPVTPVPTTPEPTTTTLAPTTAEPTATTMNNCPLCPFELDLRTISGVDVSTKCPTTTTTASPTQKRKKKKKWNRNGGDSSDSSDSRRRMMKTYQSDSDEDMNDLCFKNGDPLIFLDDMCDNGWDKKYKRGSDSGDHMITDAFLAPICVSYKIEDITDGSADCGTINNIFLGLCTSEDTDFDVSLLGTGDVDNILNVEESVNVLSASGYRNADDELGVQVVLTRSNAMWFKICFENVAVTTTFNKERHDLDVATNGAIVFTDWSGDTAACTSLGLPCLNFFFGCEEDLIGPEKRIIASQKSIQLNANHNCDCDRGMTALTLRYVGDQTAASIVVYNARWRLILCTFTNVKKGEKITCTADNTKDGTFTRQTRFSVSYENRRRSLVDLNDIKNADCVGLMQTSCAVQIIGDKVIGCSDLVVISHVDGDGALCNARILALETDNTANAYINDYQRMYADPLKVLDELDPYIRWTLICIMITFVVLVFASIYICFVAKSRNLSEDDDEDDVLKSIAETKKHGLHTQTRTICRSISEEENMNEEEDEQNIILAVRNRLQMTTSFP